MNPRSQQKKVMPERDKVCVGPLKGCTPYDQQVRAKEKTYKKGSRFVSDLSRVVQHQSQGHTKKKVIHKVIQDMLLATQRCHTIRCQAQEKDSLVEC